jgi:integrase
MKGSIQKKGKIYYAVIPIAGKRKWFRGGTKKDAEKILAEKVVDVSQGTYREMPKITFQDFSKLWLESYAKDNVKPSTLSGYNHTIEKRLIPAFGHLQMSNISTRAMQLYVADRRRNICGKSILNEVVLLKTMFKHAYKWDYIKINPCEHLERPKTVKPEIDILEPTETSILLDNSSNLYRIAFLTAILTGVRAGELWALQWGDLDWNSMKIYIRRSVWRNQFQTPKSKSAIRKIDLPDTLIPELRKWKLACPLSEHDLMFPSQDGQITCHDNAMKRHFNQALRRAKLRHVSFHSLRHTNASIRIQAGQNIKYMSSQLGHASVKITLDTYGHLFNDQDFNRRQVDMLEKTFYTSVRNPLEKPLQNAEKGLAVVANPL